MLLKFKKKQQLTTGEYHRLFILLLLIKYKYIKIILLL